VPVLSIGHQRAADGQHLPLAAGQLMSADVAAGMQPREQLEDPLQRSEIFAVRLVAIQRPIVERARTPVNAAIQRVKNPAASSRIQKDFVRLVSVL
jgi:hypothetical protein